MHPEFLGEQIACVEFGVNPGDLPLHWGRAKVASQDSGVIGRSVASAAYSLMNNQGLGHTAPACHLLLVSKQATWHPQYQEVIDTVLDAARAISSFQKQAVDSGDVTGAIGSLAKGVGYGSLAAGTGLGSLFWLLSRHASQDDADIEAMKRQRDYYDQLTSEIESSMRRKYQYDVQGTQKPKPRAR